MTINANLLVSAFSGGGRSSRFADFVVVTLPGFAFVTTSQEFLQVQNWARSRASLGNAHRDRSVLVDRLETVLARSGGGVATRGARSALSRLVAGMTQSGMQMDSWAIPHNLHEGVEVKKKPKLAGTSAADPVLPASQDD